MISKNDFSGRYYEREDEVPWSERPHWFIQMLLFSICMFLMIAYLFGVIK